MKQRIQSIDIVRGLIMIIMTLDHARDFFHFPGRPPLDMQTTTPLLFFTRWITHFCAPTFVFLSGVSAFLAGQRRTKPALRSFLFKRGVWLVVSDLLIMTLLLSFDPGYHTLILEVLWAIGFGMILLAALLNAPVGLIAATGAVIVFGHNIFDFVHVTGTSARIVSFFVSSPVSVVQLPAGRVLFELYAGLPWAGVLLLGYAAGRLYRDGFDALQRRGFLLMAGSIATALFLVLRAINIYGDPSHWSVQTMTSHTILSFLNTTKQVPSLLFVLMTLGPVLMLLSFVENATGRCARICRVYGNVPYFYFILHFTLLRVLNVIFIAAEGLPFENAGSPLVWQAKGFGHPLWVVYIVWAAVLAMMYFPCRWYGKYKAAHNHAWLSYI